MKPLRAGSLSLFLVLVALSLGPATRAAVTVTENRTVAAADRSLEGEDVVVDRATLTVAGPHTFRSLQLLNGAVLNHPPAPSGEADNAVRLTVTGDVLVDATSRIDVSGAGYSTAGSPGAGTRGAFAGGGGGHGGFGTGTAGNPSGTPGTPFGSLLEPDSWGGPGGSGGNDLLAPGGGLIHLAIDGSLTLAGSLRANGATATVDNQGGGAGGTVWVRCAVFRGAGSITADGGSGEWVEGGGGGGGRIAVRFGRNEFSGEYSAVGGGGAGRGGAGTVYLKPSNFPGEVRIRNASRGASTPIDSPVAFDLVLGAGAVTYPTQPLELGNLTVGANALLMQAAGSTGLVVRVLANARIEAEGVVSSDGRGYPLADTRGPGAGGTVTWAGAGGGHAGLGGESATGARGGSAYGSILQPTSLGSQGGDGSGGAGAAGGGLVRLIVGDRLIVEGRLSAEGLSAGADNAGGGAGGSLWIQAAMLEGAGVITANGGSGEWVEGGGGGGGRIALYLNAQRFAGRVSAQGAGGRQRGGAGTVYTRLSAGREGVLRLDNGGTWGQLTPLTSPEAFQLFLTNNAAAYPESDLKLARLELSPNSVLTHLTGQPRLGLEVAGDVLIAEGAQITADGKGYPILEDAGPGVGATLDWSGSGAGHGGLGGYGRTGVAGGEHYGSILQPTAQGSRGGAGSGGAGAPGGGAIRMIVGGRLLVDGQLSAHGLSAGADNAGGGAGGSLWLTVGTLAGKGSVGANGGSGEWVDGGGGGGGRVAVYFDADEFQGALTATGGGGNQRGGAGTLYRRRSGTQVGEVLIHNGGIWGQNTPLASPEAFQVILEGMAVVYPESPLTLGDLEIRTNSVLTHLVGQAACDVHVLRKLTVAPGGALSADGRGYPVGADRGPGAGDVLGPHGSGAGHGGRGGTSRSGLEGAAPYGSQVQPVTRGSQGGNGSGGAGGAGGGALRLVADQEFVLEGRVSAVGLNGVADNSGGGSGGSIFLTAGTFSGSGLLTVDGGSGEWVDGGGGAGGRIALHLGRNYFTGTVQARGGGGFARGGSGSIYTRLGNEPGGLLVLDNGGNPGALTPLEVPPSTRLVLSAGTTVHPVGNLDLASLHLKPGATLTHTNGQPALTLNIVGDLTLEAGSTLTASGKGFPLGADHGPGAGLENGVFGAGGAHGGNGGIARPGDTAGGVGYGSVVEPVTFGSSGGPGGGPGNPRSPGGGAIRVVVGGTFTLDGNVTSDGVSAWYDNQGAGAGGSVWITAANLTGAGSITANGGGGEWVEGGSGGGGRVALHLGSSTFAGTVTARGGGGGFQVGGAGTIYTRLTNEPVARVLVENGGRWGALTPLFASEPFDLTLENMAQGYVPESLVVGSLHVATNTVLTHLKGQDAFRAVVLRDARIEGVIDVNGRGFPLGNDPGPGAGGQKEWSGGGAGHGGLGAPGRTGAASGTDYGAPTEPTLLGSQGGAGSGGPGGHGGGAIRLIVGQTLTLDGTLTANGLNAAADNAGGGSGGSILVSARTFAGGGNLTANGGGGEWVDGGGGAGGRIAVYRTAETFTGNISVQGGGGFARAEEGSIHRGSVAGVVWLSPATDWIRGETRLEVAMFSGSTAPGDVVFRVWKDGLSSTLAQVPGAQLTASATWDTRALANGSYELEATVLDAAGTQVASARRVVMVQNGVEWRGGMLGADTTWNAGLVQVVDRDLTVASGVTLKLQPGVVIKFLPGTRLVLQGGARLEAPGTATLPIVLTSFLDDGHGGDSNLDGAETRPQPGAWRFIANAGATFTQGEGTRLRFQTQTYGGTLPSDEIWTADSMREISDTLIVPNGVTLRIEGGAVVKFATDRGLDVQNGGRLIVAGTPAQPVVFTSRRDDAFGGDTNQDGARTAPAAGDWRSLRFADGASGTFDHAQVRYGGNSVGNPWGAGGAIEALGGPVTMRNSIIADALKDGAFCYGTTRFENCLVLRCDRGLTAVGTMDVVHCTVDQCRIGLLEHVGQLNVRNSIVSRSINAGIEHDLGGGVPVVTSCNVWNPEATRGNYSGVSNREGTEGNIAAEPRYKDAESGNFRLNFASPGIDAADGSWSSTTDLGGAPRYDDPRTGNTGTPAANGATPDMGAYEFAESAPSNLDLAVASVIGPAGIVAGQMARIEWTILNRGAEAFTGPWHDAIYLRNATTGERLRVAEPLVGRGSTLGPGQTYTGTAEVRVPGGVVADYLWVVEANSRGDVFEGANASNNEGTSEARSAMSVPSVPLDGTGLSSAFTAQEESQWFRVSAPAGKDVRVALDLAAGTGATEIYVGRGFMPTADNYTVRQREFGAADTSAIAPGTGEGVAANGGNDFYVLVVGRVLPATPTAFTLSAATAPFSIETVATGPVGNAGEVTLDIRGAGFAAETVFTLRGGGQERVGLRQSLREAGRAFVTFDLRGVPAGPAEIVATLGGLSVARAGAVTVVDGGTGDFYAQLSGPAMTRAGRFSPWFITYGNRGSIDVRLPLLRFRAPGATEFQIFDNTLNWADSMTLLAFNPEVLLPTLGPGQEVTFQVRVKAMNPLTVHLEVLGGDEADADATPLAWSTLAPPAGADTARWTEMIATLPGRLGSVVADYRRILEEDLAELAADPTRYSYLANVNGRWLFGDELETEPSVRPIIELPPQAEDHATAPGLQAKPGKKPGDGIRRTWWVVVQIRGYDSAQINDLNNVEADFRDIGNFMLRDLRVPTNQIVGGIDRQGPQRTWNRQAVVDAITSLKGQVDADDNLVVSYSGHGGRTAAGNGYMCLNGDNMSAVTFQRAIDEVGAGTTYFINDSCHSEAFNNAVQPANTTFVGFAGSKSGRVAWDDPNKGGYLLSGIKSQLRKCHGLGLSMELTEQTVSNKFAGKPQEKHRQQPVLTNPTGASLEGKPWNDPSGFEQILKQTLNNLRYHPWQQAFLNLVGSVDPNEKHALAGVGPEHWIQHGQALPFEVLFENKTNAAAPAQEVLVTDDLDPRLDWSTFELTSVSFNDARIAIPAGRQRFTTTTTVGTDPYPVDVDIHLNPASGRITCLIRSRDPATGDLPEDPFAGFLPPNDATHRGEGSFSYTLRAPTGLADGTILTNQANIIFDPTYGANPPILTPIATNTVDGLAPTSLIQPLPAQGVGEIPILWSGGDAAGGSGIGSYDIYVSRDDGAYQPWLLATKETSARFTGESGSVYRFYSIARDRAGNTEAAPVKPDATIAVGSGAVGPVAIAFEGGHVRLTYTGILQSAPGVSGPWSDVAGATSPFMTTPSGGARFFRARR